MDIYRRGDGMWQPIQTLPFLEMILLDKKSFHSSECLPRKSSYETKLQFTLKYIKYSVFHMDRNS